jgi:hypothetical protein
MDLRAEQTEYDIQCKEQPSSGPSSDAEEPGERVHIVRCSLILGKGPGNLDVTTPQVSWHFNS